MAIIKGVPVEDFNHISKTEARNAATNALITCVKISEKIHARLSFGSVSGSSQDVDLLQELQQLVDVDLYHNIERLQNYILQSGKKRNYKTR